MRSFSSVAHQAVVTGDIGGFIEWAPETLTARERTTRSDEAIQEIVDEAVAEAIALAQSEFAAREAELIARAEGERDQLLRESYDRGYEEGRIEGELAEAARLRTAVRAAEEALDSLRTGEIRWTGTIEENVCALAVVVARQVIGRELKADVGPVAELVRSALTEFPIDQPLRIRINPSDLNCLSSISSAEPDSLKMVAVDREARWLPDPSIAPGGCVVEGRDRIIDGRVDTALERVYRRLTYTNA